MLIHCKTTLVNTLSGMVETNGGSIVINGAKLNKIKPHEVAFYGVTRTFQDVRLFNQMTVMDNLLVVLTERNVFGSLFEKHNQYHLKEVEEILNKLDLSTLTLSNNSYIDEELKEHFSDIVYTCLSKNKELTIAL